MPIPIPHPLADRPALHDLVTRLHAISLEQERNQDAHAAHFPKGPDDKALFEQQLVALDEDKSTALYLLLRTMGARRVVEAGTSYGVSLLWILAAVTATESSTGSTSSLPALVIGTENEPKKAAIALNHVREAFNGSIPACLNLLEGDLLETLPEANLADRSIDALLLDIWAPLALPTLKIILPKLRVGALILIDNTATAAAEVRYKDLLTFVRDPANKLQSVTMPYTGGFDLCVFTG